MLFNARFAVELVPIKTSYLVLIDGFFEPIYWFMSKLNSLFGGKRKKTSKIIAIKFFGMGSLVRMAFVLRNSGLEKQDFTLITLSKNKKIVEELGLDAIFIRFSIYDVFTAIFTCWASTNTRIVDLERSSNIAGIFRIICSLGKPNSSFYFQKKNKIIGNQLMVGLKSKSALTGLYEIFEIRKKHSSVDKSNPKMGVVLININAGEYLPERKFSIDKFYSLIKELHEKDEKLNFVLTGSYNEKEYVQQLEKRLISKNISVKNEAGQQNISDLIKEIRKCQLIITNDSGPLHIANYYDIPTIAIWGPTSAKMVGYPDSEIMKNISLRMDCSPCFHHPKSKVAKYCNGKIDCLNNLSPKTTAEKVVEFKLNLEK